MLCNENCWQLGWGVLSSQDRQSPVDLPPRLLLQRLTPRGSCTCWRFISTCLPAVATWPSSSILAATHEFWVLLS